MFDWGLSDVDVDLLNNLVPDPKISGNRFIFFLFKACVLHLYHTIQIITFLTRIVVVAWVSQGKTVIQSCYSLSQLNMPWISLPQQI